jgi:hypothetical protein
MICSQSGILVAILQIGGSEAADKLRVKPELNHLKARPPLIYSLYMGKLSR